MFALLVLVLAVARLVTAALVCNNCLFDINAAGSPTPSPMIKQWAFAYSLLKPEVNINFAPIGGDESYTAITTPCRKTFEQDFIVSDINFFIIKPGGPDYYGIPGKDLGVYPFFAGALVLPYNLPSLPTGSQLVFTRELIWKIWTREVTNWNDPAFKQIQENNALNLPDMNITLVLQDKDVGNTVTIQQMLLNEDNYRAARGLPKWGWGVYDNWTDTVYADVNWNQYMPLWNKSDTIDRYPKIYLAKSEFAVVSNVLTIEGSLGYAPLSFTVQAGLTYAKVKNQLGQTIDPAINSNLASALNYAFINGTQRDVSKMQNILVADNAGNNSYPLTAFYYLVVHKEIAVECDLRREMFKFFNWILTSSAAAAQVGGSDGYALFDTEFLEAILVKLQNVTCQGKQLLAKEFQESQTTIVRQAAISISAILLTITALILGTLSWKRNNRITKAAGLTFATCFLLGCILNYVSVFVWALIPTHDSICQSRYVTVTLGFTLLLGAMFAKCWEISKIFKQARTGDMSPIQELPWYKFCQVFFSVVGINFIFLIVLNSYDPPKTKETVIDELELIAIHGCTVDHQTAWLVIEFLYFSGLILWGGYLAYQTRDIWEKYNYPNESRSILLSIYNLIFCGIILIPLADYLEDNIEIGFFLIATAILFPTSFALFIVYGPKIISFLGSQHSKGSKGSKGSQAKSRQTSRPGGVVSSPTNQDGDSGKDAHSIQGAKIKSEGSKQKDEKQTFIVEEDRGEIDEPQGGLRERDVHHTTQHKEAPTLPREHHDHTPDGYESP